MVWRAANKVRQCSFWAVELVISAAFGVFFTRADSDRLLLENLGESAMGSNANMLGRKIRFAVVTACTCLNMVLGVISAYLASQNEITYAAVCIIVSVCFDACDGFLARRWDVASEFGAQLDSLGDFASFCVATGALAFFWFKLGAYIWAVAVAALVFVCCGGMRLAHYNSSVDSLCPPAYFEGLPTTAAAAMMASFCIVTPAINSWAGVVLTVAFGLLMVCKCPYPKLTKMDYLPVWFWLVPLALAAINLEAAVWICCSAYLLCGPLLWLRSKWRR